MSFTTFLIISTFTIAYIFIMFENSLRIDKAGISLLTGVFLWIIIFETSVDPIDQLNHTLLEISQLVFFLMAAMTIVELIDSYDGFSILRKICRTNSPHILVFAVCLISFFMSSVLDNLATTIVMVTVLKKMVADKQLRMKMGALVVISANAGGAWTPIGDVTTTMLWMEQKVETSAIITKLFAPSFISMLFACLIETIRLKTNFELSVQDCDEEDKIPGSMSVFIVGICSLLSAPVLKYTLNIPPYMALFIGLGILWVITDLISLKISRPRLKVSHALTMIDSSSLLFFIGILLSVGALEQQQILSSSAQNLITLLGDASGKLSGLGRNMLLYLLGIFSGVIDNVPLVAALIKMFGSYERNDPFWIMLAYCAGTGGSITIIGSAAGISLMGSEGISFSWYIKNIFFTALISYTAGFLWYLFLIQQ